MLFNTPEYFAFFGVLIVIVYCCRILHCNEKYVLLLASMFFYAQWSVFYLLLIYITITVDFFLGKRIVKRHKLLYLLISVFINLSILLWFKYSQFILDSIACINQTFGFSTQVPDLNIILPVGISFYTFQSLSYTIDLHRGKTNERQSYWDYALFISFFPQLVAGPIIKARVYFRQLDKIRRFTFRYFKKGIYLIILGLCKKIVIADNLAMIADPIFDNPAIYNATETLIGIFAFTFQIYFDFSGYTDIAIGSALILGFHFPKNFNYPYIASSVREFWKRWHISLSTWLRDYLYISMGGNKGSQLSTYMNIMITMLLGGLWHGASWNFVIWGALNGLYMVLERWLGQYYTWPFGSAFRWLFTFVLISFTWVFFRSTSLNNSFEIFNNVFNGVFLWSDLLSWPVLIIMALIVVHFLNSSFQIHKRSFVQNHIYTILITLYLLIMLLFTAESSDQFIYFQF